MQQKRNIQPKRNGHDKQPTTDERRTGTTAPGVAEEAGELCGKYVKGVRAGRLNADYTPAYDMSQQEYDEFRRDVLREAGDVLWRLAAHCKLCGFTLNFVAETNLAKLRDRQERGVINGEGDDR